MGKIYDNNRLKRLRILDKLLSDAGHEYTMNQIIGEVRAEVKSAIDRYAVMRDLKFIEEILGIEVVKKKRSIDNRRNNRRYNTYCYHYKDPEHSLFRIDLTDEERAFLGNALALLDMKGIANTKMFRELRLKTAESNSIISFTKNPLEKTIGTIMSNLINNIRHKEVISFKLRDRLHSSNMPRHHVHPWYLREYNRRWYLFGFDDEEKKIKHYALDRIKGTISHLNKVYIEPTESIDEILKDVIGISTPESNPIEVVYWVSEESVDYVSRKPIHHSQTEISPEESIKYKKICQVGGKYFKIFCKNNYELRREMMSFGPDLIILSPDSLRRQVKDTLGQMLGYYNS